MKRFLQHPKLTHFLFSYFSLFPFLTLFSFLFSETLLAQEKASQSDQVTETKIDAPVKAHDSENLVAAYEPTPTPSPAPTYPTILTTTTPEDSLIGDASFEVPNLNPDEISSMNNVSDSDLVTIENKEEKLDQEDTPFDLSLLEDLIELNEDELALLGRPNTIKTDAILLDQDQAFIKKEDTQTFNQLLVPPLLSLQTDQAYLFSSRKGFANLLYLKAVNSINTQDLTLEIFASRNCDKAKMIYSGSSQSMDETLFKIHLDSLGLYEYSARNVDYAHKLSSTCSTNVFYEKVDLTETNEEISIQEIGLHKATISFNPHPLAKKYLVKIVSSDSSQREILTSDPSSHPLTYHFKNLSADTYYRIAIFAIDSLGFISQGFFYDFKTLKNPCMESFTLVKKNEFFDTTKDFCVMITEAKKGPFNQISLNIQGPVYTSISQLEAKGKCQELKDINAHLLTNPERMTIAYEIETNPLNWSLGYVSSGQINIGYSNGPHFREGENKTLSMVSSESECANTTLDGEFTLISCNNKWSPYRRTHVLSSGAKIWDFSGNAYEWSDYNVSTDKATPTSAYEKFYFYQATASKLMPENSFMPYTSDFRIAKGLGVYIPGEEGIGGAAIFGGAWYSKKDAGIYTLNLHYPKDARYPDIGFRCAYNLE